LQPGLGDAVQAADRLFGDGDRSRNSGPLGPPWESDRRFGRSRCV